MREINYNHYFWQENNIRLRALESRDSVEHYYNRFDTKARLFVNCEVELPPTNEECNRFAEKYKEFASTTGRLMFTIEMLDGQNVGGVNLNSIDERNGTFSIGMQIDRDFRGKGYGTDAMRILLRYAFLERRLHKLNAGVLDGNIASITMMKKLGCVQEGVRRQVIYSNGQYIDEILFGLTKEEFVERL